MPKTVVTSPQLMQPIAHFSHGVRVGTTIHLGAAAGVDRERRLAGAGAGVGDAGAQAEQMFANLRLALGALGGDWSKVVKVKSYIVDWRDLAAYETVRSKALDAVQAATGTVGTWGFPLPQILLEAELVASLDAGRALRRCFRRGRGKRSCGRASLLHRHAKSGGLRAGGAFRCAGGRGAANARIDVGTRKPSSERCRDGQSFDRRCA